MDKIINVYVHKAEEDVEYTCAYYLIGFKCGRCGTGNLGRDPKRGRSCKVCGAKVRRVTKESDYPRGYRPFGDQQP